MESIEWRQLVHFKNATHSLTVLRRDGEEDCYLLKEICDLIGIKNHRSAAKSFTTEERTTCKHNGRDVIVTTKKGIRRLLNQSIKPDAKDLLFVLENMWAFPSTSPSSSPLLITSSASPSFNSQESTSNDVLMHDNFTTTPKRRRTSSSSSVGVYHEEQEVGLKKVTKKKEKETEPESEKKEKRGEKRKGRALQASEGEERTPRTLANDENNNNKERNLTKSDVENILEELQNIYKQLYPKKGNGSTQKELWERIENIKAELTSISKKYVTVTALGPSGRGKSFILNTICMCKDLLRYVEEFTDGNALTKQTVKDIPEVMREYLFEKGTVLLPSVRQTSSTTSVPYYVRFVEETEEVKVVRVYTNRECYLRAVSEEVAKGHKPQDFFCSEEIDNITDPGLLKLLEKGASETIYTRDFHPDQIVEIAKDINKILWEDLDKIGDNNLNYICTERIEIYWPNNKFSGIEWRDLAGANKEQGWRLDRVIRNTEDTNVILYVEDEKGMTYDDVRSMVQLHLISDEYEQLPFLLHVINATKDTTLYPDKVERNKNTCEKNLKDMSYELLNPRLREKGNALQSNPFVIPNLALDTRDYKIGQFRDRMELIYFYQFPIQLDNNEVYDFFSRLDKFMEKVKREVLHKSLLPLWRLARGFCSYAMRGIHQNLLKGMKEELDSVRRAVKESYQILQTARLHNTAAVAKCWYNMNELPAEDIAGPFTLLIREEFDNVYEQGSKKLAKKLTGKLMTNNLDAEVAATVKLHITDTICKSKVIKKNMQAIVDNVFPTGDNLTNIKDNLKDIASENRRDWKIALRKGISRKALETKVQAAIENALDLFKQNVPQSSQESNDAELEDFITKAIADAIRLTCAPNIQKAKLQYTEAINAFFNNITGIGKSNWQVAKANKKETEEAKEREEKNIDHLVELRNIVLQLTNEIRKTVSTSLTGRKTIGNLVNGPDVAQFYYHAAESNPKEMASKTKEEMKTKYRLWKERQAKVSTKSPPKKRVIPEVVLQRNKENLFGKLIDVELNTKNGIPVIKIPELFVERWANSRKGGDTWLPPIFTYGMMHAQRQIKLMKEVVPTFTCKIDPTTQIPKYELNTQILLPLNFQASDLVDEIDQHFRDNPDVFFYRIPASFNSITQNCELIFLIAEAIHAHISSSKISTDPDFLYIMASVKTNIVRRYCKETMALTKIPFSTAFIALKKTMEKIKIEAIKEDVEHFKKCKAQLVERFYDEATEHKVGRQFTTFFASTSFDTKQDIDDFLQILPNTPNKESLITELKSNLEYLGPISIADPRNADYRYIQKERADPGHYRESSHITGLCLLNTTSMARYNYTCLPKSGNSSKKAAAPQREKGKQKKEQGTRSDDVIRKLLTNLRNQGLQCYICFEYEYRISQPKDERQVGRKINGAYPELLFPRVDLAECSPAPLALLNEQIRKQNFALVIPIEKESAKRKGRERKGKEKAKEGDKEKEKENDRDIYHCFSVARTGLADDYREDKELLQRIMKTHYKTLQKTQYFRTVVMNGEEKSVKEEKQILREFASKTAESGSPLHAYLWSIWHKRPLIFIALDKTTNQLGVFERTMKKSAQPLYLAYVALNPGSCYMLVTKVNEAFDSNKNRKHAENTEEEEEEQEQEQEQEVEEESEKEEEEEEEDEEDEDDEATVAEDD